jgi:hypothetical protein
LLLFPVLDLAVGSGGHDRLVSVLGTDTVRRGALGTEYFDHFHDMVVLADHPAVLDKPVALGCAHVTGLLTLTTAA